jgi:serine protease Do
VKFDNKDIKEMRDLPRVVADTPVGKEVQVVVIRKGKEEARTVKLGRLQDDEKQASLTQPKADAPEQQPVVKKTLGLDLANLSDDLRKKFKVKDSVDGNIVIVTVDPNSPANQRLFPGDVIVAVQGEAIANIDALQARLDQLKKDGKKVVMLLVAKPEGETRFVALSLQ